MCDDLISRQAAIDKKVLLEDWTGKEYEAVLVEDIKHLPSAQPERKTGKWIPMFEGRFKAGAYWFACSNCQSVHPGGLQSCKFYCETCGADMRGEHDV